MLTKISYTRSAQYMYLWNYSKSHQQQTTFCLSSFCEKTKRYKCRETLMYKMKHLMFGSRDQSFAKVLRSMTWCLVSRVDQIWPLWPGWTLTVITKKLWKRSLESWPLDMEKTSLNNWKWRITDTTLRTRQTSALYTANGIDLLQYHSCLLKIAK